MKSYLDIDKWERKEHYLFYKGFDEPFFGITAEVDCTVAYLKAKTSGKSFYLYYLHQLLRAINSIEALKYRMEDDKVAQYESVNISPTIPRPNGTFGFGFFKYYTEFEEFYQAAEEVINRVKSENTLVPGGRQDVVHFSAIPWLKFTSISHARHFAMQDSIPKLSTGKVYESQGRQYMPVSVHANHALVDGYHIGLLIESFQVFLNEEE